MRKILGLAVVLVLASLVLYSCKSVETTSAMLHNQHGVYDKAIEMAKLALKKNPNDAEAHFQLGISYSYTDSVGKAFQEFMTAKRLDPKKAKLVEEDVRHNWTVKFNEGLSEYQSGNYEGAVKAFEEATQADPRNVKGWLNLTKVYYMLGKNDSTYFDRSYVAVDTLLSKVRKGDSEYADAMALAGKIMVRRGMKDKALEIFQNLINEDSANFSAVEEVGNDFLAENDYENATPFLEMAVDARRRAESENFDSYYNLGICYYNLKEPLKAVNMFREAVRMDPESKAANYSLLLALFESDLYDEAIMQGKKYTTEIAPDDFRGWLVLSRSYNKKGLKINAEEAAEKAQELMDQSQSQ